MNMPSYASQLPRTTYKTAEVAGEVIITGIYTQKELDKLVSSKARQQVQQVMGQEDKQKNTQQQ